MEINLKDILSNWGINEFTIFKRNKSNGERYVHFIKADNGEFVLKVFHPGLEKEHIERYTSVLYFLGEKENKLATKILRTIDNCLYVEVDGRFMYLMEYIKGEQLEENIEDEYKLGQAAARLHSIKGCNYNSCLNVDERINNMYNQFEGLPFKKEYDEIIASLPDFNKHKQCFIHTDIGPHNAMKTENGEVVFIDFDDAGMGSLFIDLGYPLIMQFVQFDDKLPGQAPSNIEKLHFRYEAAKAFYDGYFSITPLTDEEKELIFQGAVFMQLMYTPCFGEDAVKYLWAILKYALNHKEEIMAAIF